MKEVKDAWSSLVDKPQGNEIIKSLYADEKVLSLLKLVGLNDAEIQENLPLVAAFQEDYHVCEACPGRANCPKNPPLTRVDLHYENKKLTSLVIPCEKNNVLQDPQYNFLPPFRDFPAEWLDSSRFSLPKTKRVADVFRSFRAAISDSSHPWVYLQGDKGAGKSFLLVSYSNGYAAMGKTVCFVRCKERFDQLKMLSIKDKGIFDELMVRLATCDLLVLDDFGKEYHSDYVRDTLLLPILLHRQKEQLLTFFSSQYSLLDVQDLWSYSKAARPEAEALVALVQSELANGKETPVAKGFEAYLTR